MGKLTRNDESWFKYDPTDSDAGSRHRLNPINLRGGASQPRPNHTATCRSHSSRFFLRFPPASLYPIPSQLLPPAPVSSPRALLQRRLRASPHRDDDSGERSSDLERAHGGAKASASSSTPWMPGAAAAAVVGGESGAGAADYIDIG